MRLSVVDGNLLLVDGEIMRASARDSQEKLATILEAGSALIRSTIDVQYAHMLARNPDAEVQRGSVWLMHLTTRPDLVFTPEGLARNSVSQVNRDVFSDPDELLPKYRPYADIVDRAAFLPEIRRTNNSLQRKTGLFLLARDTPLL